MKNREQAGEGVGEKRMPGRWGEDYSAWQKTRLQKVGGKQRRLKDTITTRKCLEDGQVKAAGKLKGSKARWGHHLNSKE